MAAPGSTLALALTCCAMGRDTDEMSRSTARRQPRTARSALRCAPQSCCAGARLRWASQSDQPNPIITQPAPRHHAAHLVALRGALALTLAGAQARLQLGAALRCGRGGRLLRGQRPQLVEVILRQLLLREKQQFYAKSKTWVL